MKYDDLSPDMKEAALDKYRHFNVEIEEWWDSVYEKWKEKLEGYGFEDADIKFTGFCCQGDGASFTADFDVSKFLKHEEIKAYTIQTFFPAIETGIQEMVNHAEFTVKRSSLCRYVHENSVTVELNDFYADDYHDPEATDKYLEIAESVAEYAEEVRERLCHEIYSDLYKEYEYLTSDEVVAEPIRANEIDFDEDRKSVPILSGQAICSICLKETSVTHLHQGRLIGDECCWNDRLKTSE